MSSVCPTEGLICCTRQGGLCSRSQTVTEWFTEQVSSLTSLRGSVAQWLGAVVLLLYDLTVSYDQSQELWEISGLCRVLVFIFALEEFGRVCVCWLERFTNQTVP